MALFKIHKGERFPDSGQITKATEGFAYFTTDDGKFYIDIAGDGTTDAIIRDKEHPLGNRVPLNAAQADYVKNNFILRIANGNTEDNNLYTFNGSETKQLNFQADNGISFISAQNSLTIGINASEINTGILRTGFGGTGNNTYVANRLIYSETENKLNSTSNISTDGNSLNFLKDNGEYPLITNKYNDVNYVLLKDHHDGNISLNASGEGLHLGNANTAFIRLSNNIKVYSAHSFVESNVMSSEGWVRLAALGLNNQNALTSSVFDFIITRSYTTGAPEAYTVRATFGSGTCTLTVLGGNYRAQRFTDFRVVRDNTNHKAYFEIYLAQTPANNTVTIRAIDYTNKATLEFLLEPETLLDSDTNIDIWKVKLRTAAIISNQSLYLSTTEKGLFLTDSTSSLYGAIYDNGSNLWVGATATNTSVHTGKLYLHAGKNADGYINRSVYISAGNSDTATSSTNYVIAYNYGGSSSQPVYVDSSGKVQSITGALGNDITGNAATATEFKDSATITLSGDISGSASSKKGPWAITTTIGAGKVTNNMLAGSITNDKLDKSTIEIVGTSVALGSGIDKITLLTNLGLTNAAHYIGKAKEELTDGGTENPNISGYDFANDRKSGDIVLGKDGDKEYIWGLNGWELLGPVDTIQASTGTGTQNRMAYYSAANMISSSSHYTTDTKVAINKTSITDGYSFEVNGDSIYDGNIRLNNTVLERLIASKVADGSGWSRNIVTLLDKEGTLFARFGAYGNADDFKYIFIGTGAYNSANNLRIYAAADDQSEKIAIGRSTIAAPAATLYVKGTPGEFTFRDRKITPVATFDGQTYFTGSINAASLIATNVTNNSTTPSKVSGDGSYYLYGNNIEYAKLFIYQMGLAPTENNGEYSGALSGLARLQLGNNKVFGNSAEGVADNSRGDIVLYTTGTDYTVYEPGLIYRSNNSGLDTFSYYGARSTTADEDAYATWVLGNSVKKTSTTAHSEGRLRIYSASTGYHQIVGTSTTGARVHYFPDASGWIVTGGNGTTTGVGEANQPIYINNQGVATAVSLKPTLNNLLNSLTEGTADALVDAGYFISTNNNGATNDWYLRSNVTIWNYIKGKYSSTDTTLNTGPIHIRSTTDNNNALIFDRASGTYQYIQSKNPDNNISIVFAESNSDENTTYRFTKDEFYPKTNNSKNLGLSGNKWANVYATNFNGALKGNADTATAANITSTDNAIVRFDGTAGKFQNSTVIIDDNGYINSKQFKTSSSETILNDVGYITIYPYDRNTYGNTTPTPAKFIFTEKAYTTGVPAKTLMAWSGIDNIKINNFIGALKGNADTATKVNNTLTITLNNSAKTFNGSADTSISFYAPTTGGAANTQALVGNGATTAPEWVNISPSITITAGTASATPKVNVTVLGQSGTAQAITTATTGVYGATKLTDAYTSTDATLAATGKSILAAIQTLDVTAVGVAAATGNRYISQISETDGKISAVLATATIGTTTTPIWVDAGTIKPGSYELKATVNSGTAKYIAYYESATQIKPTLNAHFNWSDLSGTTKGYEELVLGDKSNRFGRLALYGHSDASSGSYIVANNPTSWLTHTLPDTAGWIVTAGNGSSTGAGGTRNPVYVTTAGIASAGAVIFDTLNVNRLMWTSATDKPYAGYHYADSTHISIADSTLHSDYNLYVNGATGVKGNIIPITNNTYNLGTASLSWKTLNESFVARRVVFDMGNSPITAGWRRICKINAYELYLNCMILITGRYSSAKPTGALVSIHTANASNITLNLLSGYAGSHLKKLRLVSISGSQYWLDIYTDAFNDKSDGTHITYGNILFNFYGNITVSDIQTSLTTQAATGGYEIDLINTAKIKLGAELASGYWGITTATGANNDYIRTTTVGLIPYQSGGVGDGHSTLGTSGWRFKTAYINDIYSTTVHADLNGNADTATKFSSNATVTLTGDTTGTSAGSTKSWSVPTITSALTVKGGRIATADSAHAAADHSKMYLRIATDSMTTNKPKFSIEGEAAAVHDGHILEFHWDNSGAYNEQLALSNSKPAISVRAQPNGTWSAWTPVLTSINTKWVAWGPGTTAGPTAKLNIGGTTITSAAIPYASTSASGIVTTGEQSFTGKKTFNWLRVVNNSSNNADDALFYIEKKNSNDWAQKILLDTFNYGLYIQGTGTSLLKVGTNNNFTVNSTTAAFGQQANPMTITMYGRLVIDRTDITYTAGDEGEQGQSIPLINIKYKNTGSGVYEKNILNAIKTTETGGTVDAATIALTSGGGNLVLAAGEHMNGLLTKNGPFKYGSETLILSSDQNVEMMTGCHNSNGTYTARTRVSSSGIQIYLPYNNFNRNLQPSAAVERGMFLYSANIITETPTSTTDENQFVAGTYYHIDKTTGNRIYYAATMYNTDNAFKSLSLRMPYNKTSSYLTWTDGYIGNSIIPWSNNSYALGSSDYKWKEVYATTFYGTLSGTATTANNLKTTLMTNASTAIYVLGATGTTADTSASVYKAYRTSTAQVYFKGNTGVLMGAAWNDYAEYRQAKNNIEIAPGRVVKEVGDETLELATERLQRGCSIVSNTFGISIGESETNKLPLAVSGRVLAYPYEDREEFKIHIGWPVCSGPNGTVSIMTEEEERDYPSRIIGTIASVPDYEIWHGGADVEVNGRVWIKVR